jgi:dihydrofolate reductase
MKVAIIAAVARNGAIGRRGALPWHLPADLKRFKELTRGHFLIIGRRTWESLGAPLPWRRIVVVTRQSGFVAPGAEVAPTLEAALELARAAGESEAFVAGGAGIFREALRGAERFYLTLVHEDFEADTFFPRWDEGEWRLVERSDHVPDERNRYPWSFLTYERRSPAEPAPPAASGGSGE